MKLLGISRTGKFLAIGFSALALYVAGYFHGANRNLLYTAQFKVVDSQTKEPIDAHFTFSDRMDVWPKPLFIFSESDNLGGVTVDLPDGSHSVAWIGRRSLTPVRLPLYADRYGEGYVELQPHKGGFSSVPNKLLDVIELEPEIRRAEQGDDAN